MPTVMPTGAIFGDTGRNNDLDQIGEFGLFMRIFGTRRYSMVIADSISGSVSEGSNPSPAAYKSPAKSAKYLERGRQNTVLKTVATPTQHAAEMAAALEGWHHGGGGEEGSVRGADRKGDRVVQPTRVLPVVSVLSLVSVEYGGPGEQFRVGE
jgi:hypothetical protein